MSSEDDKVTFCTIARAKLIEFDEIIRDRATKLEEAREEYLGIGMGKGRQRYIALREYNQVKTAFEGLRRKKEKWKKEEPKENKSPRQQILDYMESKKTFPSTEDAATAKVLASIPDFEATAAECARDQGLRDINILSVTEEGAKIRELEDQVEELKLELQRALTSSTDTVMYDEGRLTEQNEKLKKSNADLAKELKECKQRNASIAEVVDDDIQRAKRSTVVVKDVRPQQREFWEEKESGWEKKKSEYEKQIRQLKEFLSQGSQRETINRFRELIDNINKVTSMEDVKKIQEQFKRDQLKILEQARILGQKRNKPGLKLMSNLKL